jgi:hypothetical protein
VDRIQTVVESSTNTDRTDVHKLSRMKDRRRDIQKLNEIRVFDEKLKDATNEAEQDRDYSPVDHYFVACESSNEYSKSTLFESGKKGRR